MLVGYDDNDDDDDRADDDDDDNNIMNRHSPAVSANPEVTLRALTLILSESERGQQEKYIERIGQTTKG